MNIAVLNPNTNIGMTEAVIAQTKRYLPSSITVFGVTAPNGVIVIDSRESFKVGAQSAVGLIQTLPSNTNGLLLACFGDPGLEEIRKVVSFPVTGLAESASRAAVALKQPFAIITAGTNWISILRERMAQFNAQHLLVDVYALSANGAALASAPAAFAEEVRRLSALAADDGARTIILGGAAFAGLDFTLDSRLKLIDAVEASIDYLLGPDNN